MDVAPAPWLPEGAVGSVSWSAARDGAKSCRACSEGRAKGGFLVDDLGTGREGRARKVLETSGTG